MAVTGFGSDQAKWYQVDRKQHTQTSRDSVTASSTGTFQTLMTTPQGLVAGHHSLV